MPRSFLPLRAAVNEAPRQCVLMCKRPGNKDTHEHTRHTHTDTHTFPGVRKPHTQFLGGIADRRQRAIITSDNNPAWRSSTGMHVTETHSTGGGFTPLTREDRDIDLVDRTGDLNGLVTWCENQQTNE